MNVPMLTGNEHFACGKSLLPSTIRNFWSWNSSNLLSNTLRGALAEFIVADALGVEFRHARNDWTDFDLLYGDCKVEVKSSAYLQAWEQHKLSEIRFSIAPSRSWTSSQCYDDNQIRHANVYVFCLYARKERQGADPMNLDEWEFYILPTELINQRLRTQKSMSLKGLLALSPKQADYLSLKAAMDSTCAIIFPVK